MTLSARVPDLESLEILVAVAEHGSLGAVGRAIGISQQAVSARIAALETRTGLGLVQRSTSGSELTPAGALLADWAHRVLGAAAGLDAGLASLQRERRPTLRLAVTGSAAEHLVPGWLAALHSDAASRGTRPARVALTVADDDEVVRRLRAGSADLGVVDGTWVARGLRSRLVARDDAQLVVKPDHPWARRRSPLPAADLARTPLVCRADGPDSPQFLARALRAALDADVEPVAPVLIAPTGSAARNAVRADVAPALLGTLTIADDLASGRVRAVAVADLDLRRELRAVWVGAAQPPAGPARDLLGLIGPA